MILTTKRLGMNVSSIITDTFWKLWRHPWEDWGLLLQAGVFTVCVRVGLSVLSLSRVTRELRRLATAPPRSTTTSQYRLRASWAVRAVGKRLLPNRPCLTQALVLQYMLLRHGDDSAQLHIGVTKDEDGALQAHAWVERNGHVLIGGENAPDRYEQFENLEAKIRSSSAHESSF